MTNPKPDAPEGCGNHGCFIAAPKGMGTNGPCRCADWRGQREIQRLRTALTNTLDPAEVAGFAREIKALTLALMSWVTPADDDNARYVLRRLHAELATLLALAEEKQR